MRRELQPEHKEEALPKRQAQVEGKSWNWSASRICIVFSVPVALSRACPARTLTTAHRKNEKNQRLQEPEDAARQTKGRAARERTKVNQASCESDAGRHPGEKELVSG
jgi:hypothetical protein